MPANTSATGGYLAPLPSPAPTQDDSYDDQLQAIIVGIVGLNGSLVRPRWQSNTPKQPDRDVDWCAIGIMSVTPDANGVVRHFSGDDIDDPNAYDELQRHETVEVLASFYGPNGRGNASTLRDGLSIAQNREAMLAEGMGFVDVQNVLTTGDLVNQNFIRRVDLTFRFRRIVIRHYPVLNIQAVQGEIDDDHGGSADCGLPASTPFYVEP